MREGLLRHGLALAVGSALAACPPGGQGTDESSADTGSCVPGTLNCLCPAEGCDAPLVCASGRCVEIEATSSSDPSSSTTDTGPATTTTSSGTSTGSTGDSSSTGGPQCTDGPGPSKECDPATPFCEAGACVDCKGIPSCADYMPDAPVCDQETGACVLCTADDKTACTGQTPVCDAGNHTCVGCSDHAQCPSGACDLKTGACFEGVDLWVDRAATCPGDGTSDTPFCEIQSAVAATQPGVPALVHVKPGTYKTKIDVPANTIVALFGEGGMATLDVATDAMLINDDARVYVRQLVITGTAPNATKGLVCLNGALWAERLEISGRKSVAIDGFGCTLELTRSKIYFNNGGGLKLSGGAAHLENTFVASNGVSLGTYGALFLTNAAKLTALYSTLVDNEASTNADSLHCGGAGAVEVRNSVVFGQSDTSSVSCPGATASDSVIDAPSLAGATVTTIPSAEAAWFVNPAIGDFHIKAAAPFKDKAVWRTGDPSVDFDVDARPSRPDTPDYAGADRL